MAKRRVTRRAWARTKNPKHFEQAVQLVDEEIITKNVICGNDLEKHIKKIQAIIDSGFNIVYIHQVGQDQEAFLKAYEKEVLPVFVRDKI